MPADAHYPLPSGPRRHAPNLSDNLDSVHIGMPGWAKHGGIAWCLPAICMARRITGRQVRFRFDDSPCQQNAMVLVKQQLPKKFPRYGHRITVVESLR